MSSLPLKQYTVAELKVHWKMSLWARWILSIIDIFSQYLVLRPQHTKDTTVVAADLLQVLADFGST